MTRPAPCRNFRTTRRVPHTAGEMFELVADVEKYPQFLPLCETLTVRRRAQSEDGERDRSSPT